MTQLVYTEPELKQDHKFAAPQIEAGYRLHGGFDESGSYVSPRTLNRWPAIRNWQAALGARGWELLDVSQELLKRENYPTRAQQKFLLERDMGSVLWNSLTITGIVEARGKYLATYDAPEIQDIVVEDLSETCLGHLNKGLLVTHGWDEGGDEAAGIGGHDAMWFAVRDLLFGKDAYAIPPDPERLNRPEIGRLMPMIPEGHEELLLLLMNVLMIEVRAESFFEFCVLVMRDPDLFNHRRAEADHAAVIVDRIRADEQSHVAYLQTAISELRSFTIRTTDGGTIPGTEMLDRIWQGLTVYHGVQVFDQNRERTRAALVPYLESKPNGAALVAAFDDLEQERAA